MSTPVCRAFAQVSGSSPANRGLRSRVSWNRVSWSRVCCNRGERLSATAASGTRVVRLDSTTGIGHVVARARPSGKCG
ncbi:hypothetical protein OG920_04055 [Streptomyces europaeiscabiei]|uniref:hypothetical protein n=1 Tax=Streptomyces TaxID=1883 RepID=UPI000A3B5A3E|nr:MULTISPECIES: hypothetical protein [Streptomyces]MDX3589297.1 hypothetical protein [Streptomyces europaeiscabiei]MDX3615044.1 hypothetical protein [Streptomyces europaeiscabiei]WUD30667.1 hypothetical protein OG858_04115 [Streptomyces europaeiscabiei]